MHGLCIRAAVLYQLSYEDPYNGKQANLLSSSTRERNEMMSTVEALKNFFSGYFKLLKIAIHCNGHIFISFVFLQLTSFHSVFHSFHGLMNSINWPACHRIGLHSSDGRALQR